MNALYWLEVVSGEPTQGVFPRRDRGPIYVTLPKGLFDTKKKRAILYTCTGGFRR